MNQQIESEINVVKARISQYQDSDLYSETEKKKLIDREEKELQKLYLKIATPITVSDVEIL